MLSSPLTAVKDLLDEGLFFVQDTSSAEAVGMLEIKPGSFVIDTCACPGGKSFAAAVEMNGKGEIRSFDLHKNKLSLIEKTAQRLAIKNITTAELDGKVGEPSLFGKADYVICDAPCSGLGVIAKKPEIRYKNLPDIVRLPGLQYEILCKSALYLKPGGKMLYSTCTLNRAENDENVDRFLAEHPDFCENKRKTFLPDGVCDGFFCSVLQRKG